MKKIFRNILVWALILSLTLSSAFAATYTASTEAEFFEYLNEMFENRETDFTVKYSNGNESIYSCTVISDVQKNLSAFGDSTLNYDYSAYNLYGGTINYSRHNGNGIEDDIHTYKFIDIEYMDTAAETEYVKERVVEIIDELGIRNADDITKIKSIYEYMTSNFVYDYTYSIYSAYDGLKNGTMVCQGYAILTSYLFDEVGIECRIITGRSGGENHAWNIVLYDGLWYNLDTTWDGTDEIGTSGSLAFFMKSDEDFLGHDTAFSYESDEFLAAHPKATTSFEADTLYVSTTQERVGAITIRCGIDVALNAILPYDVEVDDIVWTVDDPSIATISEDGHIVAVATGETWVSASSPSNPDWVSSKLPVTCVDMTTISSWAIDDITTYYLAGGVPSDMCSDYQAGITRAELAYLASMLMAVTSGYDVPPYAFPFTDTEGLSDTYVTSIYICYYYGLMNGKSDTEFAPNDIVTREEAAAILVRASEHILDTTYDGSTSLSFTDSSSIASWAVESIAAAQTEGLLLGNADGTFAPKGEMTREQMMLTLARVYNNYAD